MIKYSKNLKIFYSSLINDDVYLSGFSTKTLGNAKNINSIFNFFKKNNLKFKKIVVMEQIHSSNISFFKSSSDRVFKKVKEADGVITKENDVVLVARNADCLPLVFVDKEASIIGVSHQGWRGSIKRMSQKMIEKMIQVGARKEKIIVAFGPVIGQCCYNIDEERYYQFKEEFNDYSDNIFSYNMSKIFLNLSLLNYLQLLEKGLEKKNIDFFPFCTLCDKKRFFSFRRYKKFKRGYGEMFNFILKN